MPEVIESDVRESGSFQDGLEVLVDEAVNIHWPSEFRNKDQVHGFWRPRETEGALGGIVGWPIFMTIDIIGALFWGAVSGEWKGASRRALVYNWTGVGVLMVAIVISSCSAT
jgi:hypothetical protein